MTEDAGTTSDPPVDRSVAVERVARPLVDDLIERTMRLGRSIFVAIDGRSGAGKSTLAAVVADACTARGVSASVIGGDEFYAGGTAQRWDQRSPAEKAAQVIDWRRQRRVLDDLRTHGRATWHPFDWEASDWDSEPAPRRATATSVVSADVVILEGAYSARPELHRVLDVRVLLDPPPEQRRLRLLEREGDEYRAEWEGRWSAAEDHYFGDVMAPDRFDHVL